MHTKLFGINNCDKVKKSRTWLKDRGIDHVFHDYKKDGIDEERLKAHLDKFGWEVVTNRKGLTWRKLPDDIKEKIVDASSAFGLLCNYPSIIKRPILEIGNEMLIDFNEEIWSEHLK